MLGLALNLVVPAISLFLVARCIQTDRVFALGHFGGVVSGNTRSNVFPPFRFKYVLVLFVGLKSTSVRWELSYGVVECSECGLKA